MANTSATGGPLLPVVGGPAPVQDDALDDLFQELIVGVTGLPGPMVRPAFQVDLPKQPEAAVDWCAFQTTTGDADFQPTIVHNSMANAGLGRDDFRRQETIVLRVSMYGPNAYGYASLLRDGLTIPQNGEFLKMNLLAFATSGTIRQVPDFINQQWVKRQDFSMTFNRVVARSYAVQNLVAAVTELISE